MKQLSIDNLLIEIRKITVQDIINIYSAIGDNEITSESFYIEFKNIADSFFFVKRKKFLSYFEKINISELSEKQLSFALDALYKYNSALFEKKSENKIKSEWRYFGKKEADKIIESCLSLGYIYHIDFFKSDYEIFLKAVEKAGKNG